MCHSRELKRARNGCAALQRMRELWRLTVTAGPVSLGRSSPTWQACMNLLVSPPTTEKPTLVRYKVLAWACALSMITYIDRVCLKEVAGDMQRELGLTAQQFALAFSAFGLAY